MVYSKSAGAKYLDEPMSEKIYLIEGPSTVHAKKVTAVNLFGHIA